MENPYLFPVEVEPEFVEEVKITCRNVGESSEHLIVITSQVVYLCSLHHHFHDSAYYFEMVVREVIFSKLPPVYDIAVEYQYRRVNGFQIGVELGGLASVCPQMDIRQDYNLKVSFWHGIHV